MSDWIEWKGGPSPVTDDQVVEVRYRGGEIVCDNYYNKDYFWEHRLSSSDADILAYRIVEEGE